MNQVLGNLKVGHKLWLISIIAFIGSFLALGMSLFSLKHNMLED